MTIVRNQAEASKYFKAQEREASQKLFEQEPEILEFLQWADSHVTKKVRARFQEHVEKFQQYFESQKWKDEAEARGLAYALRFLKILERMVAAHKRAYQNIQTRKQKEG